MINLNGKCEPELVELKKVPFESNNNTIFRNWNFIITIILVIGFFAPIGISILIYKSLTKYYEGKILEKDKEIEKIQEQMIT